MTLRYVPFLFIVVAAVACRGRVAERVGRSQGMPTKASGVVETDGGRATEPVPTGEVDTAGSDAGTRDDAAPEDLVQPEELVNPETSDAGARAGPVTR